MKAFKHFLCFIFFISSVSVFAQNGRPIVAPTDSVTLRKNPAFTQDSVIKVVKGDTVKVAEGHSPRKATLRSLMIPGWGQAYNKEYWKIPIVYGAIGTAVGFWIYNNSWYKRTKEAYEIRVTNDASRFPDIHPTLQPLGAQSLSIYRNAFRRDRDYATLYILLMWGLNIVDATVFAHLKEFDVSEDLSIRVNPVLNTRNTGFSLVLGYKAPTKNRFVLP